MNFKQLYTDSKSQIAEAIIGNWKEIAPKMVERYGKQLDYIISKCISDNIVVENMAHWTPASNDTDWRRIVSPKIWRKKNKQGEIVEMGYPPYEHQYKSWKALLDDKKSIVVTSGTGSGKTECFMVPLVHDLTKDLTDGGERNQAVEAIFLYPLNALMEDQKERINKYITFSEKNLKFAVYNGNTPETSSADDNSFTNEIVSRDEIRREKPNILFTNPSMLEYMLLRKKDSGLFTSKLKWIVIDETHTYKGAAGAELAMLIRRILKACGTDATKIKFATSSATIGSDDAAKVELKKFISQITGQSEEQIEIIEGFRTEPKYIDDSKKKLLNDKNFVLLKELIPEGTIEEKLEKLDEWTEQENGLRIRLHYYLQTLNQGLYINPHNVQEGQFLLSRSIPLDDEGKLDTRYLDAFYCKECGAILGYGELDSDKTYKRITKDEIAALEESSVDEGADDNDDNNSDDSQKTIDADEFYVGLFDSDADKDNPNTLRCNLNNTKLEDSPLGEFKYKKVEVKKGKVVHQCPCCGFRKNKPMNSFRMSADFISRLIAPILLKQTTEAVGDDAKTLPSKGRKYITFADSRQSVAGPTLKQNLETEEVWVTGVLYKKLIQEQEKVNKKIKKCRNDIEFYKEDGDFEEANNQERLLLELQEQASNGCYLTWGEALKNLEDDSNFERMFLAFAKTNKANDNALSSLERAKAKKEYALSALYRVMSPNHAYGKNSPENWGLICTHYPSLKKLAERTELPPAIKDFNNLIADDNLIIRNEDWYDYVKIFIDYDIRRHERFFFKLNEEGWEEIDYSVTRQYRTGVASRRPIDGDDNKSKIEVGDNRYTKLLLNLLNKKSYTELTPKEKNCVEEVIEQLKKDLVDCQIKEVGEELDWQYDMKRKEWRLTDEKWKKTKINNKEYHYMNLSRIAFKLYNSKVWFDEKVRIPIDTTFKGYSPERNEANQYTTKCSEIDWTRNNENNYPNIKEWFEHERACIKHKWTSKLERILDYSSKDPNTLYIQAEHTAQVARSLIKEQTDKFKRGDINIMACSTTMEMGVDLGDLELVVMNNVPPHPANYKQRAGRAGRGDQNKSAAVTICGCDASGEALMHNPLTSLICAPIEPPKINLDKSQQLVQRHINSFLFRKYITETQVPFAPGGEGENDRGYKVSDLFTTYKGVEATMYKTKWIARVKLCDDSTFIWPGEYKSLKDDNYSHFSRFLVKLDEYASDDNVLEEVNALADGALGNKVNAVSLIHQTKKRIQEIADSLHGELNAIREQWKNNCDPDKSNGKDNPWRRLNYKFTSILNANLLSYLSTHQFTPNANMPVGIVEMVIDDNERHSTENPSRDMRTALSEYAPGRKVFINGATYLMGGVRWNHSQANRRLKKCCNNHTWLDELETCRICQQPSSEWGDGFGKYIEVMTPTGFYPHKETSRITQRDALDLVLDTALIGVGNWSQSSEKRLYMMRTNEVEENSQIFYYNKGLGYGYYVCKECGYAVPAPSPSQDNEILLNSLYPIKHKKESYHNYHGWKCAIKESDNLAEKVFKNVVFGGTIQTDYCEIALFDDVSHQMQYNQETSQIAYTLGLMLCREFTNRIGCDRSEVDFIVRRQDGNSSICIFDTAKGGNGYSKRLKEGHLLDSILDSMRKQLMQCKTAEKILDRTTMKYADKVNVRKTFEWLEKEFLFRKVVPQEIKDSLPNREIRVSSYQEVENAIMGIQAGEQCVLFFNGEYINRDWNFNIGDVNWQNNRGGLNEMYPQQKVFVAYNMPPAITSYDEGKMKLSSRNVVWKATNNPLNNLFPIAQIGSTLYFTDEKQYTALNGRWAAGNVFSVDYDSIPISDLKYVEIGDEHYTYRPGDKQYCSDDLFDELYDNSERLRDFISTCDGHKLKFTYHEEYLRTHLGMTMVLQFILKLKKKANAGIELIEIIGEEYDDSHLRDRKANLYDWNTSQPRYLQVNCLDNELRDEYVENVFLQNLYPDTIKDYCIESREEGNLPHWRSLIVTDKDTGAVIEILPNGGFANGWKFDDGRHRIGGFFNENCDIGTSIPIKIIDQNGLLYDIKVR